MLFLEVFISASFRRGFIEMPPSVVNQFFNEEKKIVKSHSYEINRKKS
jgi:hypothetical protein